MASPLVHSGSEDATMRPEDDVTCPAARPTRCLYGGDVVNMLAGDSIRADPG